MTPARAAGIAAKRAWEKTTVPIARCLSGNELLAERRHIGDGTSFRMGARRLRWPDTLLLAAICYAMLVRRQQGLVASLAELGELAGLKASAIGDALRKLRAWGLVTTSPTFTAYGACHSQRSNCYRVTTQLVDEYRLQVPDGVDVPTGTVDPTWRPRSRVRGGIARAPASRNPEANPEVVTNQRENLNPSGMARGTDEAGLGESASPIVPEPPDAGGRSAPTGLSRVKARRGHPRPAAPGGESRDDIRAIVAELELGLAWRSFDERGGGAR